MNLRHFVIILCFHRHSRFGPPIFVFSRIASGSRPNLDSGPLLRVVRFLVRFESDHRKSGRVARVASRTRGFFPLSLASSEFGISSRPRYPKLGSFFSSFWVRFPNAPCVFNNILASFVSFLCFFGVVPPGSVAGFPGREIGESGSPGIAQRLHRLPPER